MSYEVTCRCRYCGTVHTGIIKRKKDPNPPCPNVECSAASYQPPSGRLYSMETMGSAAVPFEFDPASGKAPSQGGTISLNKAIDATAEITMQMHGLTDLKDNIRMGDTMAPKLPPNQQQRADSFFAPTQMKQRSNNRMDPGLLARRAMAGAFSPQATGSPDAIAMTHAARLNPGMTVIQEGKPNRQR